MSSVTQSSASHCFDPDQFESSECDYDWMRKKNPQKNNQLYHHRETKNHNPTTTIEKWCRIVAILWLSFVRPTNKPFISEWMVSIEWDVILEFISIASKKKLKLKKKNVEWLQIN